MARRRRPLRVTIIGMLSILAGLIYLFPALDVYGLGYLINLSGLTFHSGPLVLTAFIIAIANFVIGLGCMFGWRPIWFYLLIISVINFAVATLILLNANQTKAVLLAVVWLAIAIYVLFAVLSRKTRTWFQF
jgi:hypothetical protein